MQHLIVKNGGQINDAEPVTEVWPGTEVTVVTTLGRHRAKKVVIAPGPWANDILKNIGIDLPLKVG